MRLLQKRTTDSYMDENRQVVRVEFRDLLMFCKTFWLETPPEGTPNVYLAQKRLSEVRRRTGHANPVWVWSVTVGNRHKT